MDQIFTSKDPVKTSFQAKISTTTVLEVKEQTLNEAEGEHASSGRGGRVNRRVEARNEARPQSYHSCLQILTVPYQHRAIHLDLHEM